ncbi:hypothetical protein H6F74_18670 [Trichocoleus sp. FACHB-90]|nr:hypothetical protein [Trichocoleus sp. FACHB-90]MBD1928256.1 hypothetical protein [Trichocoleus sp. FACHB-90]
MKTRTNPGGLLLGFLLAIVLPDIAQQPEQQRIERVEGYLATLEHL